MFHFVTSAGYIYKHLLYTCGQQASLDIATYTLVWQPLTKHEVAFIFNIYLSMCIRHAHQDKLSHAALHSRESTIKVT